MEIFGSLEIELMIKLLLIFILSGIIGLQREALSKPAGLGTHVLVGISAVLVMECGLYLQEKSVNLDASRISAQLLSGIGFLGAGTILRDGFSVKGLTTAASLLAVTCIGLIIGAGFYFAGIISTVLVYLTLVYSKFVSEKLTHSKELNLEIQVKKPKEIKKEIEELFEKYDIEIAEMNINEDEDGYIRISAQYRNKVYKNEMIISLMAIENVKNVIEI